MKKSLLFIALLILSVSSFAQNIPKKAFYGGLGASYNLVKFSAVDANTLGLSNVYIDGNLVLSGSAGGPYVFPESTDNRFAPNVQLGYFQLFNNSDWLWGSKLTYSYIGSKSVSSEIHIPQVGSVGKSSFTGDAVVQSFEYRVNNQMTLTPYFGVSVKKAFFYLGPGLSLSETIENINGVVGYAFIGDKEVNISGAPTDFSSTDWSVGFAAVAGGTYFISSSLFLDFSYTYCQTGTQTNNFTAPFTNSQGPFMTSGELIGSTSTHEVTNSFTLTLNKIF